MKLDICPLPLDGIKLIRSPRISDARGYYAETYVRRDFVAAGIEHEFIQDNQSRSYAAGTVRGLHFQVPPLAQTKLVRALQGRILDVVVDLRRSSPTYGKHLTIELNEATGDQLLIPTGFAHGFCTLEPGTEVLYKASAFYAPEHDVGLAWDDPDLAIAWPVARERAILSLKDRRHPRLRDLPKYF